MSTRREGERGFVLLEVLVAFAIAALALSVLIGGSLEGLRGTARAARMEEAVSHARSHLAAIGHGQEIVPGARSTDDGGGFTAHVQARVIGRGDPASGLVLYAVSVTILWSDDGTTRSVTLDSQRTATMVAP
jgi:general secretion pathway protein I